MAQRFDVRNLSLQGDPIQVSTGVMRLTAGQAGFSVSDNGVLAIRKGPANGDNVELAWFDQAGKKQVSLGSPALFKNPNLSPDGKRVAISRRDNGDIWIIDLERGDSTRFTFDPGVDDDPVWSPETDSSSRSRRTAAAASSTCIARTPAEERPTTELLLKTGANKIVSDWSADGRTLLYHQDGAQGKREIWALSLPDRQPTRLIAGPFNQEEAALSPDRRWIALHIGRDRRPTGVCAVVSSV